MLETDFSLLVGLSVAVTVFLLVTLSSIRLLRRKGRSPSVYTMTNLSEFACRAQQACRQFIYVLSSKGYRGRNIFIARERDLYIYHVDLLAHSQINEMRTRTSLNVFVGGVKTLPT